DHAESNEKMILSSLGADIANIRFESWHTSEDSGIAAANYEKKLIQQLGTPPSLDLVLLGMGTDGHTASLFPGTEALHESSRFAVSNVVPQLNATRVTLTFPALKIAQETWFLVKGADKSSMVERLLKRDPTIPSACVEAENQHLYWWK
ncbi:MAG: 6-phosphogluconolactonase, partial [Verrucomicrobiota bacterium]